MALASKNELRPPYLIFFLNYTLKTHFLYHLISLMNKGGDASITCQPVGHMPACRAHATGTACPLHVTSHFPVYSEDLETRAGKVKVSGPSVLFC